MDENIFLANLKEIQAKQPKEREPRQKILANPSLFQKTEIKLLHKNIELIHWNTLCIDLVGPHTVTDLRAIAGNPQ